MDVFQEYSKRLPSYRQSISVLSLIAEAEADATKRLIEPAAAVSNKYVDFGSERRSIRMHLRLKKNQTRSDTEIDENFTVKSLLDWSLAVVPAAAAAAVVIDVFVFAVTNQDPRHLPFTQKDEPDIGSSLFAAGRVLRDHSSLLPCPRTSTKLCMPQRNRRR